MDRGNRVAVIYADMVGLVHTVASLPGQEKLYYDKMKKKGSLLSVIISFTPCSCF